MCSSVIYVSSNEIGCVSGHPEIVGLEGNNLSPSEVSVSTVSSGTSETIPILNWEVRLAEGYSLPIIVSVELDQRPFRPGAIAVDKQKGYVYWGDTLERTIRRSRVDGSFIELVVSGPVSSQQLLFPLSCFILTPCTYPFISFAFFLLECRARHWLSTDRGRQNAIFFGRKYWYNLAN